MKVTVFLAICLVQVFAVKAMTDEQKEHIISTATTCQKDTGASDIDLEELMTRAPPSTKTGKCMRKCIMEKFKLLKDGKLDVDASEDWAKKTNPNEPAIATSARQIAQSCSTISDPDGCEYIAKLIACFKEQATSRGFDVTKIF